MSFSFIHVFLYSSLVILQSSMLSESAKVVMNGVSEWEIPQVQKGDSCIFQLKFHYNLYIFQTKKAFSVCNFTQATILTGPNSSSYTWHPSHPGFFYFAFDKGSNKACLEGQKLVVKVSLPPPQNQATSISGRFVVSSPAFPWPFQPRELARPSPAQSISLPYNNPVAPHRDGIPLISSNPAVPLPTGEVDSATILPLSTSGLRHSGQVVGFSAVQIALSSVILLMMMII